MLLLFREGQRPNAFVLRDAIIAAGRLTITHALTPGDAGDSTGFELLRDGMTYDLVGLAPGDSVPLPERRHRYGFDATDDSGPLEAIAIRPGPHLAAGAHSLPVVRTMAGIAVDLAAAIPATVALAWPPAQALIGPGFFAASVSAWLAGGAFPALGLTAFDDDPGGGMRSEGLAWFTGQELLIAPDIAKDRAVAARLAIRLVNQLVARGRLTESEFIVGPEGGRLALEPTRDGNTVRVRRA